MSHSLEPLVRILDTNGNGTGTTNAIGNYTAGGVGTTDFYIQPAAGTDLTLARLIVQVEDTAIVADDYGNIAGGLTNGVQLLQVRQGDTHNLTGGIAVKNNADWARICHDSERKAWGPGNEFLTVRYTFARFTDDRETIVGGLRLIGHASEKFVVRLSDNLTGLVAHYFTVEGTIQQRGESWRNSQ
jgi:hypothetical protein